MGALLANRIKTEAVNQIPYKLQVLVLESVPVEVIIVSLESEEE